MRRPFFVCILIFYFHYLFSSEVGTIKIGHIDFPPLMTTGKDGKSIGIGIEKAKKILSGNFLKSTYEMYPPKRLYHLINLGKIDVLLGPLKTPYYKNQIISSKKTLYQVDLRAYYVNRLKETFISKEDFKNRSVIIYKYYEYNGLIMFLEDPKNNITLFKVDDINRAVQLLKLKRADFLLLYKSNMIQFEKEKKTFHSFSLNTINIHFIVSKKSAYKNELLQLIDK